ncbi:MAG: hypothetical protein DME26_05030, partial [Verrucomicrobia bacterium]
MQRARRSLHDLSKTSAASTLKDASLEQARILVALFSGSVTASELLAAHPQWISEWLAPDTLRSPRQEQGLQREVSAWLPSVWQSRDFEPAFAKLRQFKQREMLRIAARDLARLTHVAEITREISNVADVCLRTVLQLGYTDLSRRLGEPYHLDLRGRWERTQFCVLGLGKLGGQEL